MKKPFIGSLKTTQLFGEHPEWYKKFGLKGHNGIDYAAPTGTHILAPFEGEVLEAAMDAKGYGLYVKIQDEMGCVLAHLSKITCKVGDVVSQGQKIGLSGNTGNSTGPHLHFGVYPIPRDRMNGYAGFIDPLPYLQGGDSMDCADCKYEAVDPEDNDHKERGGQWFADEWVVEKEEKLRFREEAQINKRKITELEEKIDIDSKHYREIKEANDKLAEHNARLSEEATKHTKQIDDLEKKETSLRERLADSQKQLGTCRTVARQLKEMIEEKNELIERYKEGNVCTLRMILSKWFGRGR